MSYLKISLCYIKYLHFIIVAYKIKNVRMIKKKNIFYPKFLYLTKKLSRIK